MGKDAEIPKTLTAFREATRELDSGKWFVEENVLQMHRVEEKAWEQMSGAEQAMLTQLIRKFSNLIRSELKYSEK